MNSLARSEQQNAATAVSTAFLLEHGYLHEGEFDRLARGRNLTWQSGLPLAWDGDAPRQTLPSARRSAHLAAKRAMDITLSGLALIALGPLLLFVALLVMVTSKGPALFRQEREGINGTRFRAYKFRSMRTEDCDMSGVAQTVHDDPRITPIGRFLRKTSIDELPQLLNVIKGDMSLVGPRPHVPDMLAAGIPYRALVPYYGERLVMRPGITGWAQANGYRGMTKDARSSRARIDHDIAYIQNFSVWLDLRILVKTVISEFVTGSGH